MLEKVQRLSADLNDRSAAETVTGTAGGGKVSVEVSGEFDFRAVHLDESIVATQSVDLLEDLVLAALRDAAEKVRSARADAVGEVMSSALSGMFGQQDPASGDQDALEAMQRLMAPEDDR